MLRCDFQRGLAVHKELPGDAPRRQPKLGRKDIIKVGATGCF